MQKSPSQLSWRADHSRRFTYPEFSVKAEDLKHLKWLKHGSLIFFKVLKPVKKYFDLQIWPQYIPKQLFTGKRNTIS